MIRKVQGLARDKGRKAEVIREVRSALEGKDDGTFRILESAANDIWEGNPRLLLYLSLEDLVGSRQRAKDFRERMEPAAQVVGEVVGKIPPPFGPAAKLLIEQFPGQQKELVKSIDIQIRKLAKDPGDFMRRLDPGAGPEARRHLRQIANEVFN